MDLTDFELDYELTKNYGCTFFIEQYVDGEWKTIKENMDNEEDLIEAINYFHNKFSFDEETYEYLKDKAYHFFSGPDEEYTF